MINNGFKIKIYSEKIELSGSKITNVPLFEQLPFLITLVVGLPRLYS